MNLTNCIHLRRKPLTGTWYRAIQPQFWVSALATSHTRTIPGRFNAGNSTRPGFEILYLAEDHQVALFEVQALLGSPNPGSIYLPNPRGAWTILNVDVQLDRIVDLTLPSQRRLIETTAQELTGDWQGYSLRNATPRLSAPHWTNVPTQRLGAALHAVGGLEGFITYSAKVPTRKNLIVFPRKIRPGNHVRFFDPSTGRTHQIP